MDEPRINAPSTARSPGWSAHVSGAASIATLLLAGALAFGGCNALTGADDYTIDHDFEEDGSEDGSGPSGGPGGPSGGPTGGDPTGGDPAGTGSSTGGPTGELGAAAGVYINEVSIYQAVKRPLMQNGQPASSSVPVVAGRDALVRVFVGLDAGYDGSPVTARLHLGEGSVPLEVTQGLSGASNEESLGSTINFQVPGASLSAGVGYKVEIGKLGVAQSAPLAYPATGFESTNAQSVGASLKIMLVPVAYGADGSNRMPDISAQQVERYRKRFHSMYPAPQIDLTVHETVGWDNGISPNGSGWDSLLNAVAGLRESDNSPSDVYYYGIFAPAQSFGAFCGGGCVAGLGMIGGPNDDWSRSAIGLGFSGDEVTDTAVHEIGHTHGREHAPCQVGGADPSFPHSGGKIGEWGYDMAQGQLISPNTADLMGYCFPIWISDYTYKAIFSRIQFVNGAQMVFPPEQMNRTYERVSIGADGVATWLDAIEIRRPPMGEPTEVTLETENGPEDVTGAFFPYDHLPGGVLLVQRPAGTLSSLAAKLGGNLVHLTK